MSGKGKEQRAKSRGQRAEGKEYGKYPQ